MQASNLLLSAPLKLLLGSRLTGAELIVQVFAGHHGPVSCGSFTPDGKAVVTGGGGEEDASLRQACTNRGTFPVACSCRSRHQLLLLPLRRVWNPKTGECTLALKGHPFHAAGLTCLDVHPDSTAALTGSEDGTAKVVSLQTGKVASTLAGHSEGTSVEAVAFSRHLPLALSAGLDGKMLVWDVTTGTARGTCDHPDVSAGRLLGVVRKTRSVFLCRHLTANPLSPFSAGRDAAGAAPHAATGVYWLPGRRRAVLGCAVRVGGQVVPRARGRSSRPVCQPRWPACVVWF